MQKYFTKEISQSIKVIVLGLAIGLGVSFVSANWTAPVGTAPDCTSGNPGCDAPINVSTTPQVKGNGIFTTANSAGSLLSVNKGSGLGISADGIRNVSSLLNLGNGMFGTSATNANVAISGHLNVSASDATVNGPYRTGGIDINLTGQPGWGANDFLYAKTDPSRLATEDTANAVTNASAFRFYSDRLTDNATLIGGAARFTRGGPSNGKVLAAYDSNGSANWGTIGGGGLDIVVVGHKRGVTNMDEFGTEAFCPADHPMLLGGGGDCQSPAAIRQSMPITNGHGAFSEGNNSDVVSSEGGQSGWYTNCKMPPSSSNHDVHAWAICAKSVAPTVTVAALPAPAAPVQKWRSIGPDGVPSQTCLALAGVTTTSEIRLKKNDNGAITYTADGSCYYESINSTQSNPIINNFPATYSNSSWYPVGQVQGLAPNGYDYTLEAFKY